LPARPPALPWSLTTCKAPPPESFTKAAPLPLTASITPLYVGPSFRRPREMSHARQRQRFRSLAVAMGPPRARRPAPGSRAHPVRHRRFPSGRVARLRAVAVQLVWAGLGDRGALPVRHARHQRRVPPAADAPRVRLPALAGARPGPDRRLLLAGV